MTGLLIGRTKSEKNLVGGIAGLSNAARKLPPIFARKAVPKLLGNAIAAGKLANLGKIGPPYFFVGRNAVYDRKEFLEWLKIQINCT